MRLIDADALKRKMQKVATEAWKMKLNAPIETTFNQCIDYINSAPTIEPQLKGSKRLLKGKTEPQTDEWSIEYAKEMLNTMPCEDCRHWEHGAGDHYYCALLAMRQECCFESKDEPQTDCQRKRGARMITEPLFKDAPTFRNYEDYLYGEAYTKGWNDAMRFIFILCG